RAALLDLHLGPLGHAEGRIDDDLAVHRHLPAAAALTRLLPGEAELLADHGGEGRTGRFHARPVPRRAAADKAARRIFARGRGRGPLRARYSRRVHPNDHDFAPETTPHRYPPDRGLLPVHLEIDVRLDIPARRAEVALVHHLRVNDPEAKTLVLDGVDLENVVAEGAELLQNDGRRLTLVFDGPAARGETRVLRLRYEVRDPRGGLYFSSPSAHEPDAPRFAV